MKKISGITYVVKSMRLLDNGETARAPNIDEEPVIEINNNGRRIELVLKREAKDPFYRDEVKAALEERIEKLEDLERIQEIVAQPFSDQSKTVFIYFYDVKNEEEISVL